MKKVCHITSVHRWDDTRIFYKECCTLVEAGWAVSLIAANGTPGMHKGVKLVVVKNTRTSRLYRATVVAWRILRSALKEKPNVVHFHDPELIWVGLVLRVFGKKVVYDVHENLRAQIEDKPWLRFPKTTRWLYGLAERISVRSFSIVIAADSFTPTFAAYGIRPVPVLNFPQVEALQQLNVVSANRAEKDGILYVGLVSEGRCFIDIVRALHLLKTRNIRYQMHAVGPMEEGLQARLEGMTEYREVKDQIHLYGRLPVFEAYRMAEKCSIALSLLKPLPNYTRSISTKVFEYMSLGIPFITSRFPVYQFIEDEKLGVLCNAEDYRDIADKLHYLMTGGAQIEDMIQRSKRVVVEKYSWESQAAKLKALYMELEGRGDR
jgi:glycosyltransferase involved in cell wall biosynthesis